MADERPPIWVQLTTEYYVTGFSGNFLIGIDDTLWRLSTEKIVFVYKLKSCYINQPEKVLSGSMKLLVRRLKP
ncbi:MULTISPECIES: hypothetical protein [Lactiplantibacillus]|uniref:Uncharacterized protein n=1 Tax=Lactiplantibacillus pentosus TaxID=1589 RepID=A0ABD7IN97_LACPE|nr:MULTISPECIES: hypothetical protein [Lactiplantibacillus]MCM8608079.1 hypothetical protein [Lactiplantibacillus sp. B652]PRO91638.1 hypothetical protein C6Y08_16215 [Lactiplantibacillus pentosus]RMW45251.1 hypothetical protein D6U18_12140 [Lactiplantibacillus pentosus]